MNVIKDEIFHLILYNEHYVTTVTDRVKEAAEQNGIHFDDWIFLDDCFESISEEMKRLKSNKNKNTNKNTKKIQTKAREEFVKIHLKKD